MRSTKECPYCKSEKVFYSYSSVDASKAIHNVYCKNCGARGPTKRTYEEAVESWQFVDGGSRDLDRLIDVTTRLYMTLMNISTERYDEKWIGVCTNHAVEIIEACKDKHIEINTNVPNTTN